MLKAPGWITNAFAGLPRLRLSLALPFAIAALCLLSAARASQRPDRTVAGADIALAASGCPDGAIPAPGGEAPRPRRDGEADPAAPAPGTPPMQADASFAEAPRAATGLPRVRACESPPAAAASLASWPPWPGWIRPGAPAGDAAPFLQRFHRAHPQRGPPAGN